MKRDDELPSEVNRGSEEVPGWVHAVRAGYHPPPDPPRDEMWEAVRSKLRRSSATEGAGAFGRDAEDVVVALEAVRESRTGSGRSGRRSSAVWSWTAAAAAVLVIGVAIGRWTATGTAPAPDTGGTTPEIQGPPPRGVELAALLHFERSEPLLQTVRSDARSGRIHASVGPWARGLLTETRLLMDARGPVRDDTQRLLADLELVLVQILGAADSGPGDTDRAREELDLAVRSLERGDLLPRIRSAAPTDLAGS